MSPASYPGLSTQSDVAPVAIATARPMAAPAHTLARQGYHRILRMDAARYAEFLAQGTLPELVDVDAVYFAAWRATFAPAGMTFPSLWRALTRHGFTLCSLAAEDHLAAVGSDYRPFPTEDLVAVRFVCGGKTLPAGTPAAARSQEWMSLL